jgi:two-component system, chemotaxis family, sensor kinase Cph1
MNALVHDLLDLAKIEAGRFEVRRRPEPVRDMADEAMVILRPLAEAKRIAITEDVPEDAMVDADRERFFQVISNLVGNAIKFTPEEGRIVLRAEQAASEVVFSISDSGPGISEGDAPHLFDRYWQARKRNKEGTGLGLYIAKGIVEAHGGRIWIEPQSAPGACFKFVLPSAGPAQRSELPGQKQNRRRI